MRILIRKSIRVNHKYYKREGTKGNYKYYYTQDEYEKEHKLNENINRDTYNKPYQFNKEKIFHEWIFNNNEATDIKKTKAFNKWLKEHKEDYVELYHGTSAKLPILEQGLKRTSNKTKKSYQSETGFVYLNIYPSMAETFGSMAYGGEKVSVYAVKIQIKDLLPDKDQLRNSRYYGQLNNLGDSLAESLNVGSGARVKRDIMPYEIKKII